MTAITINHKMAAMDLTLHRLNPTLCGLNLTFHGLNLTLHGVWCLFKSIFNGKAMTTTFVISGNSYHPKWLTIYIQVQESPKLCGV